jgi:hypothetical protein
VKTDTRFSTRRPRVIDDTPTAQSGNPLTWATIWQGIRIFVWKSITAPFRWVWRLFTR